MNSTTVVSERESVTCSMHDARDMSEVGNKAYHLAEMLRLGLNVPAGFVITNAAFQSFCDTDRTSIPEDLFDEVLRLRRTLIPSGPVVVRSSAVGEDGADASFAGQLDSILHVETPDELERALLACWSSYWNDRVLWYQRAKGIRLRGMAVIVQSQVRSRISGVLFTREPGNPSQMCIEYCDGFGDALVSGLVNPGRLQLDRGPAASQGRRPDGTGFDACQIDTFMRIADTLESHFGRPQDIEWTIDDDGKFFVLQSRPITTASETAPSQVLWSNANINENFPDPITPFLYSIAREGYYHYFRNLAIAFGLSARRIRDMEHSFRYLVGVHHARIYYNLTGIHSVLRMAPFGEDLAGFFNTFVGADAIAPAAPPRKEPRWIQALELCRIAIKTSWKFGFLTRRVERFERLVDDWSRTVHPDDLANRSLLELRDALRGFMRIRCYRWTNASLADAASMICYGLLKLALRSDPALHNNLLQRLGDVVSAQPAIQLWELSRKILADPEMTRWFSDTPSSEIWATLTDKPRHQWLLVDLQQYLDCWGFRFSGELMLTVPSFQEEPAPLFDMLKVYLKAEITPAIYGPQARQPLPVRLILRATRRAIRLRERARSKQALLYNRCRRIALAMGSQCVRNGTLETPTDIFFLTYGELDEWISGHAMFPDRIPEMVAIRKRAHEQASHSVAPDTFNLAEGEYRFPETRRDHYAEAAFAMELSGNSASGGRVTARAAVLESVADAHLLQAGDILVTRQTDPGWAPVFSLIRGLVIERGGMLSHGAIIAREFGLPCVVGVKDATTRIPHGALLSIDGDRGHVRILA